MTHSGLDIRGQNSVFTENVGRSTNRGVELEMQALPAPNTLLTADVQYLAAKFKSFQFTVPRGAAAPITGCAYALNPANGAQYVVDCSGKTGYNAPHWTLNLAAQQTVPLGRYKLVGSADTQYKSTRVAGFDYLNFQYVRPTWTTNVNLSVGAADDRWSLGAFIRNLENDRVILSPYVVTTGLVGLDISGPPRTYGVRGAIKF